MTSNRATKVGKKCKEESLEQSTSSSTFIHDSLKHSTKHRECLPRTKSSKKSFKNLSTFGLKIMSWIKSLLKLSCSGNIYWCFISLLSLALMSFPHSQLIPCLADCWLRFRLLKILGESQCHITARLSNFCEILSWFMGRKRGWLIQESRRLISSINVFAFWSSRHFLMNREAVFH